MCVLSLSLSNSTLNQNVLYNFMLPPECGLSFYFHVLLHVYFHYSYKILFSQSLSVKAVRKKNPNITSKRRKESFMEEK